MLQLCETLNHHGPILGSLARERQRQRWPTRDTEQRGHRAEVMGHRAGRRRVRRGVDRQEPPSVYLGGRAGAPNNVGPPRDRVGDGEGPGRAPLGRPELIGACTGAEKSSKKERSVAQLLAGAFSAKGNVFSSNTTCREIITLLVTGSKHRYPLWLLGYPRKTHMVERGANLLGAVAERLG